VSGQLLDRVRGLLLRAQREMPDPAAREIVTAGLGRLDEPLRVAIAGKVKAGKSTLLNAMVGEELAPTDAGECTRIVTWYRDGPSYQIAVHLSDGSVQERPFNRVAGAVRIDLGMPAEQVDHLDVRVPSRRLREQTLIDTPGLASLSTEVSLRTAAFLEADEVKVAEADAVIYLLRHMHGNDLRFLEAFHGDEVARGSPINAVGVLSRADEIGGCRLDAMAQASRVAARYQTDSRLRRLCPIVLPVAGLLAVAGTTLREAEFRSLATIAAAPAEDVVDLLLTAERFATSATRIEVEEQARRRLLTRLGLFGVRLGVQLLREGAAENAGDLTRELAARSGLDELRDTLMSQFVSRNRILKARSALAALDLALRSHPYPGGRDLAVAAEEIRASAHEFVEIRLLHLVRSGRLPGQPEQLAEMERLLGGSGAEAFARLGLPADAVPQRLAAEARQALDRWQRIAEHPLSARELRTAARATARSCEGVLAMLRDGTHILPSRLMAPPQPSVGTAPPVGSRAVGAVPPVGARSPVGAVPQTPVGPNPVTRGRATPPPPPPGPAAGPVGPNPVTRGRATPPRPDQPATRTPTPPARGTAAPPPPVRGRATPGSPPAQQPSAQQPSAQQPEEYETSPVVLWWLGQPQRSAPPDEEPTADRGQ
jgi:hypothetical protein